MARVDATHEAMQLQFVRHPPIPPDKIISFVQTRKGARFAGQDRVRLEAKLPAWPERAKAVKEILRQLAGREFVTDRVD